MEGVVSADHQGKSVAETPQGGEGLGTGTSGHYTSTEGSEFAAFREEELVRAKHLVERRWAQMYRAVRSPYLRNHPWVYPCPFRQETGPLAGSNCRSFRLVLMLPELPIDQQVSTQSRF